MYICIYVYMYICIYVYIYTYIPYIIYPISLLSPVLKTGFTTPPGGAADHVSTPRGGDHVGESQGTPRHVARPPLGLRTGTP